MSIYARVHHASSQPKLISLSNYKYAVPVYDTNKYNSCRIRSLYNVKVGFISRTRNSLFISVILFVSSFSSTAYVKTCIINQKLHPLYRKRLLIITA